MLGRLLQLFFRYTTRLVVTIHNLLLASFFGDTVEIVLM
jgi:hypothetical protein